MTINGVTYEIDKIDSLGIVWLKLPGSCSKRRWICRQDGTGFRLCIR